MANSSLKFQFANKDKVEYYTDPNIWKSILKFVPKNKKIWSPFFNKEQPDSYKTQQKLKELGLDLLDNKPDFFEYLYKNSVVIDNPPFDKKRKIIERLVKNDIPFILLMPNNIFSIKYIKQYCLDSKEFQFIMPLNRIKFTTNSHNGTTIHTCFLCYKIGLKNRMIFINV